MQDVHTRERKLFVPAAPIHRVKPVGQFEQLFLMARNPLETWTRASFDLPVSSGISLMGRIVVVSTPAGVRHVFSENAANYEKDPLQMRVLRGGAMASSGDGLLIAHGDLWKRLRRTLAPLFTPRRVAAQATVMHERAHMRVARWLKRREGAILEIDREMTGVTYDILSATLFSDAIAGSAHETERELAALLDAMGRIDPLDAMNAPSWLPRFGRGKMRKSREWFQYSMNQLIDGRLETISRGQTPPDDLLTALLQARDPETGEGLPREEIAANLLTFIVAGHETTARALAWTLYLLSKDPHWRERCEAEADVVCDEPSQWLERMPAIRAAFEEAMRLFPPVPHLSRAAAKADNIEGVHVPAGSLVVVSPWVLHRHTLLWDNPHAFDPRRFMPGEREKIDRYAYIPFGAGPRICIGLTFAMQEAMIVLANILRAVRLEHIGEEPRPVHRITLRPEGRLAMKMNARR
ncbi:MAG: cytochrome P450 [Alphaproteobacteria bacterium]|nr:cytochrome P450 [Alphaproteobacteria bacterium]